MKLITLCGPAASGKTSVILHVIAALRAGGLKAGVVKLDCLATSDDKTYRRQGIPVQVGLSGGLCPDHYFGANIGECVKWGREMGFDLLFSESAGLCNRCSPHVKGQYAVCVIDNLMGADAPRKIGPMLKMADAVAITKGDIVSQAEREVYAFQVRRVNGKCAVIPVNGVTGQGCDALAALMREKALDLGEKAELRFPMPAALCSYCLGETRLGEEFRFGNFRGIEIKSGEEG
jgi:Ni2+-binding GTPase involved in maturation of urease and hydrogenase